MKSSILMLLALALLTEVNSQVTLVSADTYLERGFPISNTTVIFTDGKDLWTSDGTPLNTIKMDIPVTVEKNSPFAVLDGRLLFSGVDANADAELWQTDGTDAGTFRIKNINDVISSGPRKMFLFRNEIYFYASSWPSNYELWKTDGTESGTSMVKEIYEGPDGSLDGNLSYFIYNNELYFNAVSALGSELWKTDGTAAGTKLVKDIWPGPQGSVIHFFTVYNNELYFMADDGAHGRELWKTNGTGEGSVMVKDISFSDDAPTASADPSGVIILNNKILFAATTPNQNRELYVSDGTTEGTQLLKDIFPGMIGSDPDIAGGVRINGKYLFSATSPDYGRELFETDGTNAGTHLFRDFNTGTISSNPHFWLDHRYGLDYLLPDTGINGRLQNGYIYFNVFYDPVNNHTVDIFLTDGTLANTRDVKYFIFGPTSIYCCPISPIIDNHVYTQNTLYLVANTELHDYEPYKIVNGQITKVADIAEGAEDSETRFRLFTWNNKLFFNANDHIEYSATDLFSIETGEPALPVRVFAFDALLTQKDVQLKWNVANNTVNTMYQLQRSYDGKNFNVIASFRGNNTSSCRYDYTDRDLADSYEVAYYRLLWSEDGKSNYSRVISVNLEHWVFTLSPNPVREKLVITYRASMSNTIQLNIYSSNGNLVSRQSMNAVRGMNRFMMDTRQMPAGSYFLVLKDRGSTITERFIKQ